MTRPHATLSTGPARTAEAVAVRAVAAKGLPAPAWMALVTRPEAIAAAVRLTDGEFRNRTRRWRLPFSRQRGANQRPMHRSLVVFAILPVARLIVFAFNASGHALVFRR